MRDAHHSESVQPLQIDLVGRVGACLFAKPNQTEVPLVLYLAYLYLAIWPPFGCSRIFELRPVLPDCSRILRILVAPGKRKRARHSRLLPVFPGFAPGFGPGFFFF